MDSISEILFRAVVEHGANQSEIGVAFFTAQILKGVGNVLGLQNRKLAPLEPRENILDTI
jgi:hypothetical protein